MAHKAVDCIHGHATVVVEGLSTIGLDRYSRFWVDGAVGNFVAQQTGLGTAAPNRATGIAVVAGMSSGDAPKRVFRSGV